MRSAQRGEVGRLKDLTAARWPCARAGIGSRLRRFREAEYTSARGGEAPARSSGVSRWLGAVMNVDLPAFGIEDL